MTPYLAVEAALSKRWPCVRFDRLARPVEVPRGERALPLLSLSSNGVVRPRDPDARQQPTEEYVERYWSVRPGELVVNPMWLIGGGIGVSQIEGAVSPDYRVYRMSTDVEPRYVHHLLRAAPYREQYRLLVRAETTFDRRITKKDFGSLPIPLPTVDEQRAIADYLDRETARIDALLVAKERLLRLAEERFQALVMAEIFGGAVELVAPLKRFAECLPGYSFPSHGFTTESSNGCRLLRGVNVTPGRLRWDDVVYWANDAITPQIAQYALRTGDLVIGMDRTWIGGGARVATVSAGDSPSLLVQRVARLRATGAATREYIRYALTSEAFRDYFAPITTGVSVPHISEEQIMGFRLPIRSEQDQHDIVVRLNRDEQRVAALRSAIDAQRFLLTEHRHAIITAAVTGQPGVLLAA